MDDFMDWLYFYYILPIIEAENQGEYAQSIARLLGILDIPQMVDFEMAMEFYASTAFRLGLRTGVALDRLTSEE